MRTFILILFIILSTNSETIACLNGATKILKNELFIYQDSDKRVIPSGHHFESIDYNSIYKELDSLYQKTKDLDYLSDKGYILILEGKYQQAVNLYLEIEKIKPSRYSTASNLGTTYELMGQNEKALFWIKKSFQIDPESHNGSEWLHVKILEAKIKGEQFMTSDFLIGTNFGTQTIPQSTYSASKLTELQSALYYQLNERISFIKPKDKIIATLLFELGNILLIRRLRNDAFIVYKKAKEYGFTEPILKQRLDYTNTKKTGYNFSITYFIIFSIIFLLSALIYGIMKRKKSQ